MKKKKTFFLVWFVAILACYGQGEEGKKPPQFFFASSIATWGLNTLGGYRFTDLLGKNMATSIFTGTGVGYFGGGYYRLPDGTVFSQPVSNFSADAAGFTYLITLWQAGIRQGLLSEGRRDLLGIDVRYQGKWRSHIQDSSMETLLQASEIAEKEGSLQHEFKLSLFAHYITPHQCHQYLQGAAAILWYRTVPQGMGSAPGGNFSFSALGTEGMALFTVVDTNPREDDLCLVLALRGGIEGIGGSSVPFYERGVMKNYLRGVDGHGLDLSFSVVGNIELRTYLPSPGIVSNLTIWPVIYFFSDNGYFWERDIAKGIFVSSAGVGIALEFAPFLVLTCTTQWRLTDTNVDGGHWVPLEMCIGSYLFGNGYSLNP